jgi:hypothetical protein
MVDAEEHHDWSTFKSWLFIIALSFSLFITMSVLMMIEEQPRQWDFGTIPFTPSESVYSTSVPKKNPEEKMIEPLPEGVSMKEKRTKDIKK